MDLVLKLLLKTRFEAKFSIYTRIDALMTLVLSSDSAAKSRHDIFTGQPCFGLVSRVYNSLEKWKNPSSRTLSESLMTFSQTGRRSWPNSLKSATEPLTADR
jgi:hypothetical protein